jgi:hypothetical protein
MLNNLFRIPFIVAAIAIILVGCASQTPTSAPITKADPTATNILPANTAEPTATSSGPSWAYVAFGD